jgi:group I intron endonuclease
MNIDTSIRFSGIYKIRCLVNEKIYVGSAVVIGLRWRGHLASLTKGNHHSSHLQRAWDKYGPSFFSWEVIEFVEQKADLIRREQSWMNHYQCCDSERGYNRSPTAGSQLGLKFPQEALIKASKRMTGKKLPDEWRQAISKGLTGRIRSKEEREATRKGKTGVKLTEAHRKALSEGQRRGYRNHPRSQAARDKLSKALAGKQKSPEHIAKMAAKHRRMTDMEVCAAREAFKCGASITRLGDVFGVSPETITNNFVRTEFNYRPFLTGRKYLSVNGTPA